MSMDRRLAALESALPNVVGAKRFDMSELSDEQLKIIDRIAPRAVKTGSGYRLPIETLEQHEIAELEKALWLTGMLEVGKRLS